MPVTSEQALQIHKLRREKVLAQQRAYEQVKAAIETCAENGFKSIGDFGDALLKAMPLFLVRTVEFMAAKDHKTAQAALKLYLDALKLMAQVEGDKRKSEAEWDVIRVFTRPLLLRLAGQRTREDAMQFIVDVKDEQGQRSSEAVSE
jgi:hypothetical protein